MKKIISILLTVFMVISLCIVFSSAEETNLALNADYTYTGYHEHYPDEGGTMLTDGKLGDSAEDVAYNSGVWVGLNFLGEGADCNTEKWEAGVTKSINNIVVDLGSSEDNLVKFSLTTLESSGVGIELPEKVEVLISDDGEDYESLGDATSSAFYEESIYKFSLSADEPVSARYVKFITTQVSAWFFVSEVEVLQNPDYTPPEPVPETTISLISKDASKWESFPYEDDNVTVDVDISNVDDAIVIASDGEVGWPFAYYDLEETVEVNKDDFNFVYDFSVAGGKTNVILFTEGSAKDGSKHIQKITHLIADEGSDQRPEGDDLADGTYQGVIKLSDLDYELAGLADEDIVTITSVKIFVVNGASVTINKLALESIKTVIPDPSDETSDESDESSGTSDKSEDDSSKPVKTGDTGTNALIIIAVMALFGMATIAAKNRR